MSGKAARDAILAASRARAQQAAAAAAAQQAAAAAAATSDASAQGAPAPGAVQGAPPASAPAAPVAPVVLVAPAAPPAVAPRAPSGSAALSALLGPPPVPEVSTEAPVERTPGVKRTSKALVNDIKAPPLSAVNPAVGADGTSVAKRTKKANDAAAAATSATTTADAVAATATVRRGGGKASSGRDSKEAKSVRKAYRARGSRQRRARGADDADTSPEDDDAPRDDDDAAAAPVVIPSPESVAMPPGTALQNIALLTVPLASPGSAARAGGDGGGDAAAGDAPDASDLRSQLDRLNEELERSKTQRMKITKANNVLTQQLATSDAELKRERNAAEAMQGEVADKARIEAALTAADLKTAALQAQLAAATVAATTAAAEATRKDGLIATLTADVAAAQQAAAAGRAGADTGAAVAAAMAAARAAWDAVQGRLVEANRAAIAAQQAAEAKLATERAVYQDIKATFDNAGVYGVEAMRTYIQRAGMAQADALRISELNADLTTEATARDAVNARLMGQLAAAQAVIDAASVDKVALVAAAGRASGALFALDNALENINLSQLPTASVAEIATMLGKATAAMALATVRLKRAPEGARRNVSNWAAAARRMIELTDARIPRNAEEGEEEYYQRAAVWISATVRAYRAVQKEQGWKDVAVRLTNLVRKARTLALKDPVAEKKGGEKEEEKPEMDLHEDGDAKRAGVPIDSLSDQKLVEFMADTLTAREMYISKRVQYVTAQIELAGHRKLEIEAKELRRRVGAEARADAKAAAAGSAGSKLRSLIFTESVLGALYADDKLKADEKVFMAAAEGFAVDTDVRKRVVNYIVGLLKTRRKVEQSASEYKILKDADVKRRRVEQKVGDDDTRAALAKKLTVAEKRTNFAVNNFQKLAIALQNAGVSGAAGVNAIDSKEITDAVIANIVTGVKSVLAAKRPTERPERATPIMQAAAVNLQKLYRAMEAASITGFPSIHPLSTDPLTEAGVVAMSGAITAYVKSRAPKAASSSSTAPWFARLRRLFAAIANAAPDQKEFAAFLEPAPVPVGAAAPPPPPPPPSEAQIEAAAKTLTGMLDSYNKLIVKPDSVRSDRTLDLRRLFAQLAPTPGLEALLPFAAGATRGPNEADFGAAVAAVKKIAADYKKVHVVRKQTDLAPLFARLAGLGYRDFDGILRAMDDGRTLTVAEVASAGASLASLFKQATDNFKRAQTLREKEKDLAAKVRNLRLLFAAKPRTEAASILAVLDGDILKPDGLNDAVARMLMLITAGIKAEAKAPASAAGSGGAKALKKLTDALGKRAMENKELIDALAFGDDASVVQVERAVNVLVELHTKANAPLERLPAAKALTKLGAELARNAGLNTSLINVLNIGDAATPVQVQQAAELLVDFAKKIDAVGKREKAVAIDEAENIAIRAEIKTVKEQNAALKVQSKQHDADIARDNDAKRTAENATLRTLNTALQKANADLKAADKTNSAAWARAEADVAKADDAQRKAQNEVLRYENHRASEENKQLARTIADLEKENARLNGRLDIAEAAVVERANLDERLAELRTVTAGGRYPAAAPAGFGAPPPSGRGAFGAGWSGATGMDDGDEGMFTPSPVRAGAPAPPPGPAPPSDCKDQLAAQAAVYAAQIQVLKAAVVAELATARATWNQQMATANEIVKLSHEQQLKDALDLRWDQLNHDGEVKRLLQAERDKARAELLQRIEAANKEAKASREEAAATAQRMYSRGLINMPSANITQELVEKPGIHSHERVFRFYAALLDPIWATAVAEYLQVSHRRYWPYVERELARGMDLCNAILSADRESRGDVGISRPSDTFHRSVWWLYSNWMEYTRTDGMAGVINLRDVAPVDARREIYALAAHFRNAARARSDAIDRRTPGAWTDTPAKWWWIEPAQAARYEGKSAVDAMDKIGAVEALHALGTAIDYTRPPYANVAMTWMRGEESQMHDLLRATVLANTTTAT